MKVSVILGHPDSGSFNHSIANAVVESLRNNAHDVTFHDLYRETFAPIMPAEEISRNACLSSVVERYCAEISATGGIVVIHPNWWGQPPAILKGWVDRVLRPGVAYKFAEGDSGEGIPVGLLKAKAVLIFNTSNTPQERESAVFGDPLETLWKNCIFGLCGVKDFYRKNFALVVTSTLEQRTEWLKEVRDIINVYFPAEVT